jgi:hypothetical protein
MKVLVLVSFLVLLAVLEGIGQPIGVPPPNPDPVPITGIEILLASGGAYGIYRLTRKVGSKNRKT